MSPESPRTPQPYRLMNPDGSLRIIRKGSRSSAGRDLYHYLLRVSWRRFILILTGFYLAVNLLFALGYLLCGPGALDGASGEGAGQALLDAFFFSVQTFATIGYGRITPVGLPANLLVTFEALFGLLGVALSTGLLFARFSRPTARVRFSSRALMTPHDGVPSFVCRVANERLNQVIEARVRVTLLKDEVTAEGERYRNLYDLKLEREISPVFALSLTLVHPITPDSPLYGMTEAQMRESHVELMVSLTGTDETFLQQIHARCSYTVDELAWNASFGDMLSRTEDGFVQIDLSRIDEIREPQPGS
jgi:inward rectifier potassium channel